MNTYVYILLSSYRLEVFRMAHKSKHSSAEIDDPPLPLHQLIAILRFSVHAKT